jgi:hypothetical protein
MLPRGKKTRRWSISCSALKRTAVSTRVIQLLTTQRERGGHHTTIEGKREGEGGIYHTIRKEIS